jgi:glutamate 5-kinase
VAQDREQITASVKRLVIKVGSTVVTSAEEGGHDIFASLAREVSRLRALGVEVVIVSSGSVATGMKRLNIKERISSIPKRQAVAALGQVGLMAYYVEAFRKLGEQVAQVLLTHDDFVNRKRFLNARNTIESLLELGLVPIINENDTVAVDEMKLGDNDELSALATSLVDADLLIILTDIDGLYDSNPATNPGAKKIDVVENVDALELDSLTGPVSAFGTGGMRTKTEAAHTAAHHGTATVVANGFEEGVVEKILAGEKVGTLFLPRTDRLTSRKHWIAFSARPTGRLFLDDGAKGALLKGGSSLLPSGIKDVDGVFDSGEVVRCVDAAGKEIARGVTNYSSVEIEKIKGVKSADIESALGYKVYDEVIHRDNLVVL